MPPDEDYLKRMFPEHEDPDDGGPVNVQALHHDQRQPPADSEKCLPERKMDLLDALKSPEFHCRVLDKLNDGKAWQEVQSVYLELGQQMESMQQLDGWKADGDPLWHKQCRFNLRVVKRLRSDLGYLMDKSASRFRVKLRQLEEFKGKALQKPEEPQLPGASIAMQKKILETAQREQQLRQKELERAQKDRDLQAAKLEHVKNQAVLETVRLELKKGEQAKHIADLEREKNSIRQAFTNKYGKAAWHLLLIEAGLFVGVDLDDLSKFDPEVQRVLHERGLVRNSAGITDEPRTAKDASGNG